MEKHKDLFDSNYKVVWRKCQSYISKKSSWVLILLFVLAVFFINSFINFGVLGVINLPFETSKSIVDQRTTNLATIISITLVVVGFLINNLAVKSSLTYKLLFEKSLFYPTVYLTLSTIGTLIIVSTIRDTIPHFQFSGAVLAGTYLVIAILILIGSLFRRVIQFANDGYISKLMNEQLIVEAKEKLKIILLQKYSEEEYLKLMKDYEIAEYDFFTNWNDLGNIEVDFISAHDTGKSEQMQKVITDINISWLKRFIKWKKKKESTLYYKKLNLGASIDVGESCFLVDPGTFSGLEKWILKKCIVLSKARVNDPVEADVFKQYYDKKLEEFTEEAKNKNLANILNGYLDLYSLEMQHLK